MKFRNIAVLVVIVVLFLVIGLNFKTKPAGGSRSRGGGAPAESTTIPSPPETPVRDFAAQFANLEVSAFSLTHPGGGPLVALAKDGEAWKIASLYDAPAESAVVQHLLNDLSQSAYAPAPDDITDNPAVAGLGYGQGFELRLNPGEGELVVAIGYGLDGFTRTYVKTPGRRGIYIADTDLRGDIGIYSNSGESLPDSAFWLETRPLAIDAANLASLSFEGPGYHANFVKDADGAWLLAGGGPESGVSLDADEFARWVRDLATLAVSGVADPERYVEIGLQRPTHVLRFGFDHGVIASVAGIQAPDGNYYVELSTRPGIPYLVPEWRFNLYFRRFFELFPDTAVSFNPADVLFADLRRDGVNVKLMRNGRGWQAIGLPFAVRDAAVEQWLSALSSWRAVDSLNPAGTPRPGRGAPVAEVSLVGDARQFRLGSMHPQLGLPYIILDNGNAFTVSGREAQAMFPRFSDLFAFGSLFPGVSENQVGELSVFLPDDASDGKRLSLRRDPGKPETWLAETTSESVSLGEGEVREIIAAPLTWKVVGLSDWDPDALDSRDKIMATIRLENGATRSFAMAKDENENISLVQTGSHAYQIARAEHQAWLDKLDAIVAPPPPPAPETAAGQSAALSEEDAPETTEATGQDDLDLGSDRPQGGPAEPSPPSEAATPPAPETAADEAEKRVFLLPGLYPSDIKSFVLLYPGWVPGVRGIHIIRDHNDKNEWLVQAGNNTAPLDPATARRLLSAPVGWTVDTDTPWDESAYIANINRMRMLLDTGNEESIGIDLFIPAYGQVLAKVDDGRAGTLDFASVLNWLGLLEPLMFAIEADASDLPDLFPSPSDSEPPDSTEPSADISEPEDNKEPQAGDGKTANQVDGL